jgi:hypothetical protein
MLLRILDKLWVKPIIKSGESGKIKSELKFEVS